MAKQKLRIDALLVERGLFESRSQAAAAVVAGEVQVGAGGRKITKPGQPVERDAEIKLAERQRFVSRGGRKLENALEALDALGSLAIEGRQCLDAGASTGGFSDCLLQRGAAHVVAVDVAYGELHWKIRQDDRVTVIERTNVRELDSSSLPFAPDLIVADLSFISVAKVLPALVACASTTFDMLALVKPQFEVGKEKVGKGGVVRDPLVRRAAIQAVADAAKMLDLSIRGVVSSGLPGPAGNRESFLWLAEGARGDAADFDLMLAAVEPVAA